MHLYSASRPLEFIAIDVLGLLLCIVKIIQYVIVIIDGYTKLTRAIAAETTTVSLVAFFWSHG